MADFTQAQIGQEVARPTGGASAVERPNAVVSGLSLLSMLAPSQEQLQARADAKQAEMAAGVLEGYSQQALRIADAVDNGEFTSREARMRMRALYSNAIANNPMLQDELQQIHGKLVSTSGLGKVIAEGTEEEARARALKDEMFENGFINNQMSPEEQDGMVETYQSFKLSERMLEQETKKLAFANAEITNLRGRIGIQTDQLNQERVRRGLNNDGIDQQIKLLNLQRAQAQASADVAMVQMATSFGPAYRAQVDQILLALPPNPTPAQRLEVEQQLAAYNNKVFAPIIQGLGPGASSEQLNMLTRPMNDYTEYALRVARGEADLSAINTQRSISVNNEALLMLQDPATRALAATVATFGDQVVLHERFTTSAIKAYTDSVTRNTVPAPNTPEAQELVGASVETWRRLAGDGFQNEQAAKEAVTNLNNILRMAGGVDDTMQPADLAPMLEAFASDAYRSIVEMGVDGFDREASAAAASTLREYYSREALPLIAKEWTNSPSIATEALSVGFGGAPNDGRDKYGAWASASDAVTVEFDPASIVRFVPRGTSPEARQVARNLQRDVGPVIRNLVRSGAHLEGSTNYREFYDLNFREVFEPEPAGGDSAE